MALLETIGIVLTTKTAGSVAKFLYEKVEGYIQDYLKGKNDIETGDIKQEAENLKDLKDKIESKGDEEATDSEVEELKETVQRIEQNKSPIPAIVISPEVFQKWSENENLDIQEQAVLEIQKLQVLRDKAVEFSIAEKKKDQIRNILVIIEQQKDELKEIRERYDSTGFQDDKFEARRIENLLRGNLYKARDLLKGY